MSSLIDHSFTLCNKKTLWHVAVKTHRKKGEIHASFCNVQLPRCEFVKSEVKWYPTRPEGLTSSLLLVQHGLISWTRQNLTARCKKSPWSNIAFTLACDWEILQFSVLNPSCWPFLLLNANLMTLNRRRLQCHVWVQTGTRLHNHIKSLSLKNFKYYIRKKDSQSLNWREQWMQMSHVFNLTTFFIQS